MFSKTNFEKRVIEQKRNAVIEKVVKTQVDSILDKVIEKRVEDTIREREVKEKLLDFVHRVVVENQNINDLADVINKVFRIYIFD